MKNQIAGICDKGADTRYLIASSFAKRFQCYVLSAWMRCRNTWMYAKLLSNYKFFSPLKISNALTFAAPTPGCSRNTGPSIINPANLRA